MSLSSAVAKKPRNEKITSPHRIDVNMSLNVVR